MFFKGLLTLGIEVRQQGECDVLTFIREDDVGIAE